MSGERFGFSVAGIKDVDGDGSDDLVVGSPGGEHSESLGAVHVYSGRSLSLLFSVVGFRAGGGFGYAVAPVGDLDGDGVPDIVVGAPREGAAYVLSGGKRGTVIFRLLAGQTGGTSVADVGDVDGDGTADIAVGGPYHEYWCGRPLGTTGAIWVYSGRTGRRIRYFEGFKYDWFGRSLAFVGDIDKDGHAEIAVGAPQEIWNPPYNAGSLVVLNGAVETQSCVAGQWGDASYVTHATYGERGDELGSSLASIGDVDGDGVDDLVAGAPGGRLETIGSAWAFSGRDGTALYRVSGYALGGYFGYSVAGLGDINRDGVGDFAVGAPGDVMPNGPWRSGVVHLFSGANGSPLGGVEGGTDDGLGYSVSSLRLANGCHRLVASTGRVGSLGWTGRVLLFDLRCPSPPLPG